MLLLNALALGCWIQGYEFRLSAPTQIDPTGCAIVTVRRSYIEYGVTPKGARVKSSISFKDGSEIGRLNWYENIEVNLTADGRYFPGYTPGGCADGWEQKNRTYGNNIHMWCAQRHKN